MFPKKDPMPDIPAHDLFTISTLNVLHSPYLHLERAERIAQRTAEVMPDIMCLQEVYFEDGTNSKTLDLLTENTNLKTVSTQPYYLRNDTRLSGTAILSSWPVIEAGHGRTPECDRTDYNSCYSVLESPSGRVVIVFSIHGAWGGHREDAREKQFLAIDEHADELSTKYSDREPITIIAGDFNTRPDSSTMRYLTGYASLNGKGSYWTDVWDVERNGPGYTSEPLTKLSIKTAKNAGIHLPELLPSRRIDYILVKGWVYGKTGTPLSSALDYTEVDDDGYTVSDHYGVRADIWNPIS